MHNRFAEKLTILGKFKSATVALRDALDGEDVDAINACLAERQQCMELVNRIDSTRVSLGEQGAMFGGKIRELLEENLSLDRDCAECLKLRVHELRSASAKRRHSPAPFNRNVLTKQNAIPRFLDIRS
jgi:hypothetical protein